MGLGLGFWLRPGVDVGLDGRGDGHTGDRARVRGRRAFKRAWSSRPVRGTEAERGGSGGGGAVAERGTEAETGSAAVLGPAVLGPAVLGPAVLA